MTKPEIILWYLTEGVFTLDANGRLWRVRSVWNNRFGRGTKAIEPRLADKRIGSNGYRRTFVTFAGDRFEIATHRIVVALVTGEVPEDDVVIHHRDSDRQNNRPSNLEVVTAERNQLYSHWTRLLGAESASQGEAIADEIRFESEHKTREQIAELFDLPVPIVEAVNQERVFPSTIHHMQEHLRIVIRDL